VVASVPAALLRLAYSASYFVRIPAGQTARTPPPGPTARLRVRRLCSHGAVWKGTTESSVWERAVHRMDSAGPFRGEQTHGDAAPGLPPGPTIAGPLRGESGTASSTQNTQRRSESAVRRQRVAGLGGWWPPATGGHRHPGATPKILHPCRRHTDVRAERQLVNRSIRMVIGKASA
jgi:hypothetical protein